MGNVPVYQKITSEWRGKMTPVGGLEIYLIRTLEFTDPGAKQCAKIFLENAHALGLIDANGVFDDGVTPIITEPIENNRTGTKPGRKPGQTKTTTSEKNKSEKIKSETPPPTPPSDQRTNGNLLTFKISFSEVRIPADKAKTELAEIIGHLQNMQQLMR